MSDADPCDVRRRFLITIGVGDYRDTGIRNLRLAPHDARRVQDLLAPMGYEVVLPGLAGMPAWQVQSEIEQSAAAQSLADEDVVVVYFAGHGAKGPDRHYLLWPDSVPGRWSTALATEDLARPLMHSQVGHLLVMLDTCYRPAGTCGPPSPATATQCSRWRVPRWAASRSPSPPATTIPARCLRCSTTPVTRPVHYAAVFNVASVDGSHTPSERCRPHPITVDGMPHEPEHARSS